MTTITIKNEPYISKTDFDTLQELFVFLRGKLSPLQLHLIDEEDVSAPLLEKIKKSKNNPNRDLTDFKG